MHLAVNRLAAAGAYALAVNIQLIVSAELPEKSIKALMESVSESCGKLHITSVQADVAAVPGLTETVITATAIGEAGGFLNRKRPRRTRILIMAGYAGDYGAAKLAFAGQAELERHFNPCIFESCDGSGLYRRYNFGCISC